MSMNEQETSASADRTGGDTSDCHPLDAREVSNVPATAEVSKGIASLPSPNKTRPGKQELGNNLSDETPPWERQSFMDITFNSSFLKEELGTPATTGRLTPGLRRLCLDGSPMMALARPGGHGHFQQATSPNLMSESPPGSFMDCSITPTGPAHTLDLPGGSGTVMTLPFPDVVPLNPQNDTLDVGCGSRSPARSIVLPCPQNTVHLPCRDSATAAVANIDSLASDINSTIDLQNSISKAGSVSDIAVPVDEMNSTTDLAFGCNGVSDAATSDCDLNRTVDLADCVGSTGATPTGQENITMEIGSDCSMIRPEVASSISTPAPGINTTVDKGNDGKSTTTEVNSIVPVHHNATVDFPNVNGSVISDVSLTARHNATVDLATPVSTKPAREMQGTVELVRRGNNLLTMTSAGGMNVTVEVLSTTTTASPCVPTMAQTTTSSNDVTHECTDVELVRSASTPVTMTSAEEMNITVEVLSTTTSASPNVPTMAQTTTSSNDVTHEYTDVELVRSGSTPVTMTSAEGMNVTVEVLNTTTTASPNVPTMAPITTSSNDVAHEYTSHVPDAASSTEQGSMETAGNTTLSDSATLAKSLSATPELMAKRPPLEVHLFMLDESLDLQSAGLVTSTPMPEHREFSFSRPAKVIGKACEARKQLVLPSNTTSPTETDGDPPGGAPPGGAPPAAAPGLPCEGGREEAKASLEQRRPQATGLSCPRAVGMSAAAGHGVRLSGLPVTRRAIPKPTRTTASLGMNTLANSILEGKEAPSGIPGASNRFSLGMKASLRSASSAPPTLQPASAAPRRLSLAPPCSARLRKKTNEGAIPSLSKDTTASSARPSQASVGLKRPVPEPKGGPAKKSKGENTQASALPAASIAGRPSRISRAFPENRGELRRPSLGAPGSNLRSGLLRKRALPTVSEDTISTSSAHTVPGASSVTAPSLDSEGTDLCECGRKTACNKCEGLQRENERLLQEIKTLKSQLKVALV